jgi:DNA-binding XRE family transcriptional regulator
VTASPAFLAEVGVGVRCVGESAFTNPLSHGPWTYGSKGSEMRQGHQNVAKQARGRVPTSEQTRWRCSTCGQTFEGERRKNCANCAFMLEEGLLKGLRYSRDSIRAQRRRLGISAEDFGKLVGVSGSTIRSWERGTRRPLKFHLLEVWSIRKMKKAEALTLLATLKADDC